MDPSPFVVKADLLLKLSGLPYRRERGDMRKAPKGKLPCIDDDGQIVPDSTLIRLHLADKHGITLDAGLSEEQKALAWSVDCMLGEHFYWGIVHERWMVDAYFERGPSVFFKGVPALLRGGDEGWCGARCAPICRGRAWAVSAWLSVCGCWRRTWRRCQPCWASSVISWATPPPG